MHRSVCAGPVKLQVQQDDQQVTVTSQQILLGKDKTLQDVHTSHGNDITLLTAT